MESHDEPLFVLKYRSYKVFVAWTLLLYFLMIFSAASFRPIVGTGDLLLRPFCIALVLLGLRGLFELLSFEEIRLYNDRIVQVRKWGRRAIDIELANARLTTGGDAWITTKSIFNCDARVYSPWLYEPFFSNEVIRYFETLADRNDVRKLNRWLVYLSGRTISELNYSLAEKLIKEGHIPRIITEDEANEVLFGRDDPSQVAYDRTASRALLIAMLAFALPACVMVFFVIWSTLR